MNIYLSIICLSFGFVFWVTDRNSTLFRVHTEIGVLVHSRAKLWCYCVRTGGDLGTKKYRLVIKEEKLLDESKVVTNSTII